MAAILAILNSIRRAVQRDLRSFEAIKFNNFFLLVALLTVMQPQSAAFLLLLLGALVLFPISSDPLAKIPASRLQLWPLSTMQRFVLRIASIALSPIVWIAVILILRKVNYVVALLLVGLAAAVQFLMMETKWLVLRAPRWNPFLYVPRPPGRFGFVIQKDIRDLFTLLDTWLAILFCIGAVCYRFLSRHPNAAAFPIISILIVIILSTYTQSLFGLELNFALVRYRLLPLRGYEILLAKDMAILGLLVVLVVPLSPLTGLTAGLAALAIGHHSSVLIHLPQKRWRFTSGTIWPIGVVQIAACFVLGLSEQQNRAIALILAGAAYIVSLWWYGRKWERG
ncbi:MAG TPA: hypothetical protein VN633_05990 [Bryobacteraceae bacterium]|nr:hypothetical protein [Bryobacteraceae bacterium]